MVRKLIYKLFKSVIQNVVFNETLERVDEINEILSKYKYAKIIVNNIGANFYSVIVVDVKTEKILKEELLSMDLTEEITIKNIVYMQDPHKEKINV